ncbi:MAG: type IV CRISPR-associated protein Csf2 [Methyloprofundus sp.]|nr:type IV CRISPR-associated protein Csf2 [Methyloprofundus sp.]
MHKILGAITLTSPLHVPTPFESKSSGEEKTRQVTDVIKTWYIGADGKRRVVPYFPANDFRGRLRREATGIILKAYNSLVSLNLYHSMSCGAVTGAPWKDKHGVEYVSGLKAELSYQYRKNVFAGLFGGGFYMLPSGFRMSDMLPAVEGLSVAGLLPYGYSGPVVDIESFNLTTNFIMNRFDDAIKDPSKTMQHCEASDVDDWVAELASTGTDRNKLSLTNFLEVAAIMPGTPMVFNMDLKDDLTDAQIGLMLLSLQGLCNKQGLGASSRKGFGNFNAFDLTLYSEDGHTKIFNKGANFMQPYELSKEVTDKFVSAFWAEMIDKQKLIDSIAEAMTEKSATQKKVAPKKQSKKATDGEG